MLISGLPIDWLCVSFQDLSFPDGPREGRDKQVPERKGRLGSGRAQEHGRLVLREATLRDDHQEGQPRQRNQVL